MNWEGLPLTPFLWDIMWNIIFFPAASAEATGRTATGTFCFRYTNIHILFNSSSIFFWNKLLSQILYLLSPRVIDLGWPMSEWPRNLRDTLKPHPLKIWTEQDPRLSTPHRARFLQCALAPFTARSCFVFEALPFPAGTRAGVFTSLKWSILVFVAAGSLSNISLVARAGCAPLHYPRLAGAVNVVLTLRRTSRPGLPAQCDLEGTLF